LAGGFLSTLIISFFATDQKWQGLFGDYARRTGLLSYFGLTIFLVAAALLFRFTNKTLFDRVILTVGFIVGIYGFLQHYGVDFVLWNNPYNNVISTVGNPDFAAALMAIFLVLSLGIAIDSLQNVFIRLWAIINTILLLSTIIFSQARQGLIAASVGVAVIVVVWSLQRNRIFAWVLTGIVAVTSLLGLIGMLNKGPLKTYLYKESVTYRGDYWRAGIRMFKSHPWFGVGLDRYGAYFRQYRDAAQVLRRGPGIVSNAAHNVPIELGATGGIFVLLAFASLTGFILWRGIVGIRSYSGIKQISFATIFAAWLTYEAQSFISIDNLGIAIWGWILGGAVIGLSRESSSEIKEKKAHRQLKNLAIDESSGSLIQPLVSGLLFLVAFSFCIPLILSDASLKTLQTYSAPKTDAEAQEYIKVAKEALGYGFIDPHTKTSVALLIAQAGQVPAAKNYLESVLRSDPRASDVMESLALIAEQTKEYSTAAIYRQRMVSLDPWNYDNLLQLGEDLKASGDLASARAIVAKIDAFAANSAESATAHKDFGS
jgi:O-antigen ligase